MADHRSAAALAALLLLSASGAMAQAPKKAAETPPPPAEEQPGEMRKRAGEIASQPARDVGIMRTEIPDVLVKASIDPYSLTGLKTCRQLSAAVTELNGALGPDFKVAGDYKESRAGKLAEAGGAAVVNSLIPFRGIVREVSGAAPAQRRLNAALDAGYARRGFLRGVHKTRGCKTAF